MIGIIAAMNEELAILKDALTKGGTAASAKRGRFEYFCGKIDGKEVVLLQSGIGKVNAAVGTALLAENYAPSAIINIGSAGGVGDKDCPLSFGDLVISTELVQHDVDATVFGYAPGQVPREEKSWVADKRLADLAVKAAEELKAEGILPPALHCWPGLIASGDQFMSNTQVILAKKALFPGLRALEMEGAAIAQACVLFATPFLVIRSISDIAGEESPVKSEEFLPLAAKHSCALARRMLRHL
jgi:adenosylhomocysteine nucleosidase